MAATVTALLTAVSSADTAAAGGTWLGNSGAADTEVKIQGNGSYTWQASKSARTSCTFTPTTNLDVSATDTHLYWWAMNAVAAFMEPFQEVADDPGYTLRLTDGAAAYKEWRIAGNDTWGGEWRCFILDVNSTTDVYASNGVLDLSDIDVITWSVDISNSGNIRIIDNQWNDVVRFGTGLKVTGTNFNLTDMAADDESSSNKYGVLENIDGAIFCQGELQIGDGATTTTFNSTDEVLIYRDRNSDGLGQVSDGLYKFTLSGTGVNANISGLVAKGAGTTNTTRFVLDCDDTDITLLLDASTFIRAGYVYFAIGDSITNSSFNNCRQIDPSTSTFSNNTISNYATTSGGALLFPSNDSNIFNLTFVNNWDSVEYGVGSDSTDPTFNNFQFDDVVGKYDVNNTSNVSGTIGLSNNSNANSYNPTGDAVSFSTSIQLTTTVKDESAQPIVGAFVYIDDNDESPYILNTTTNVDGVASTGYAGNPVNDSIWRVRKYGYRAYKQLIDIGSSNISIPITLVVDPQQV
jgi:hypothetical protein